MVRSADGKFGLETEKSSTASDVVLACNMGDFIYALPTLMKIPIRVLALPPYLVPLATALWNYIKPQHIHPLPDDKLTAANAKGMQWRSLPQNELMLKYGLQSPLNLSMRGSPGHIINRIASSAGIEHPLPMPPPLADWATPAGEETIPVLVQAESWTDNKAIDWFATTDWPKGSAQLDTGQPCQPCNLPRIPVHLSSAGLVETANLIRRSELVVSVASFTGVLAAAMGVPTIMVHRGSRPKDCGVFAFGQHDIRHDERDALLSLLSTMTVRTHRLKPKVPNMAALIPIHTDAMPKQALGPAFVIGNGESRVAFDLNTLKGKGTTFGCNALHRDFWPDFLICVDHSMRGEIANSSKYPKEKVVFKYRDRGFASGPCALSVASDRGHNPIFILGFDTCWTPHQTTQDENVVPAINNVYKNTEHYAGSKNPLVSYSSWVNHTAKVMDEHPDTKYYQVGVHTLKPSAGEDDWVQDNLARVKHLTYEDFTTMVTTFTQGG